MLGLRGMEGRGNCCTQGEGLLPENPSSQCCYASGEGRHQFPDEAVVSNEGRKEGGL